jgi:hypothetical protein
MCIRAGHIVLIDRNSFLLFALRKQPEAFGLTVVKSWYPHYINTTNLDYVEKLPDISYYEVDEISASERTGFLDRYECQKFEVIENRRLLESYSQGVVNLLQEACRVLRQEFIQLGNIDVYLESVIIA